MDEKALAISILWVIASALLIYFIAKCTLIEKPFDKILQDRWEQEVMTGQKKNKKKKAAKEKGPLVRVRRNNVESAETAEAEDIADDSKNLQDSDQTTFLKTDSSELVESERKNLKSGKSKQKRNVELKHDDGNEVVKESPVQNIQPVIEQTMISTSNKARKRNHKQDRSSKDDIVEEEEEEEEVKSSMHLTDSGFEETENKRRRKRTLSEKRELEKEEKELKYKEKMTEELEIYRQKLADLEKESESQKNEIDSLKSAMRLSQVQHVNEINQIQSRLNVNVKQLKSENSMLNEEKKIMKEATSRKTTQLEAANKTNDELSQKIDILESALQQNSKIYNVSENTRKTAEVRVKRYEARIQEMESNVKESEITVKREKDFLDEMHQSKVKIDSLTADLDRQNGILKSVENEKVRIEAELKAKMKTINKLEGDLKVKASAVQTMRDVSQELERRTQELHLASAEIEKLRKDGIISKEREFESEDLKKTVAILNDKLHEKENELTDFEELKRKLVDVTDELHVKETDHEETKKRMDHLTNELDEKDIQLTDYKTKLLRNTETEDEAVKLNDLLNQVAVEATNGDVKSNSATDREAGSCSREVTVFTHVHEKSEWDMSQLVLDLDTKEAEIQILQSLLTQRETRISMLEKEKVKLSATLETLRNEGNSSERQLDNNEKKENHDTETKLQQELIASNGQLLLAQTDIQRLQKELRTLKGSTENLTDIDFAYHCVEKSLTNIVDEMEEKVKDLESRLEVAETEKLDTLLQLSQLKASHEIIVSELHELRQNPPTKDYFISVEDIEIP